jgi:hypothetical protein
MLGVKYTKPRIKLSQAYTMQRLYLAGTIRAITSLGSCFGMGGKGRGKPK